MKILKSILLYVMLLTPAWVSAQETYTVRGRIVRATTGEGFAGVGLTSPNLKVSAMTDDDGSYEIKLPSLDVPLIVTAPGCERQTVAVQGRTVVDIVLLDRLEGTTPSELKLHIEGPLHSTQQSGQPGSGDTYFVRGLQSINLSSQPLFIIDGVEWQMQEDARSLVTGYSNNPLTMLDPDDIERVEVLKDGSAIWGSKGAAGVVCITTKRAKDMATKIEANVSMGFQTPFRSMPMMDATAYTRYATDVMRGLKAEERQQLHFTENDLSKSYYWDTHQQTDWFGEVNKTAFLQNYGINVAGGDDIALYRFSLGYGKNDGNVDGTSFGRLNVRFNSDIKLTKRLFLAADIAYAQTMTRVNFDGLNEVRNPVYQSLIKSPLYGPWQHNLSGQTTNRMNDTDELGVGNPIALVDDNLPDLDKYRFNLNLRPSYSFTDRLKLSAILGFTWDKTAEDIFLPDHGVADMPLLNEQGEVYNTALNMVGSLMARQSTLSAEGRLDWTVLDSYRNDLRLAAGGRFYNTYYKWNSGLGYNTGSDFMRALSNTNSYLRWIEGDNYKERDAAWFLTADYGYLNKYFVKLGLELSTSSRYGKEADGLKMAGVSWAFNPSLSAAWLLSSERWMRPLRGINKAQLHVTLSQTGNDRLPLFANRTYRQTASSVQDAPGLYLTNIGNEGLKWETTRRASFGIDLSMLKNRWQVAADVFWARTSDLVTRKQLNDVAGMKYYWDNDGELTNRGFEVTTSARLVDRKDWKLTLGIMMGHYNNKIQKLRNGAFTTDIAGATILTAQGQSAGVFYGWKTAGVFRDAAEAAQANLRIVAENGAEVPFEAGDVRFVDQNGDGIINDKDRIILGNPNPDVFGNFNLQLRWKRLTLDGVFGYSIGGEAYNALRQQLESGSSLWNQTAAMENRWTADGQTTDIPRATYGDPMGNSRTSDRWIEDASFLKLRRLQLTYDIPLHSSVLQGLSVWASANNLFTLTRYLGADPEFSASTSVLYQGVDTGLVPSSRSFQLGVKINL
ncbi:MAG: SusC/RagA family TonB-linked outer membrane protein [Bacteroidaceae bacterium]|nr:SusC/RagA family TonB-linked outer membrane protein [Bacteroidaceae bacterium]